MNLTTTVDNDLLKRERRRDAVADLLVLSKAATSRRGAARWTRDELYER